MSDLSREIPEPHDELTCEECGEELSREERETGRGICYECFCSHQPD